MEHEELLHMAKIFVKPTCDYSDYDLPVELLTFAEGYIALSAQLEEAQSRSRPCDWFNQVCAALGLFDGARSESVGEILWREVLPTIEAVKANNPAAAVLIAENQSVRRMWKEAVLKLYGPSSVVQS